MRLRCGSTAQSHRARPGCSATQQVFLLTPSNVCRLTLSSAPASTSLSTGAAPEGPAEVVPMLPPASKAPFVSAWNTAAGALRAGMGGSGWCCLLPSRLAMRATTGRLGMASGVAPAVTAAAAAAAAVAAASASCWRVSSGGGVLRQLRTCWRSRGSSQFQLYTPAGRTA